MIVDPQGRLTLCCHMHGQPRIFQKKITDVDSLLDFFDGEEYAAIRKEFEEDTWRKVPECKHCRRCYDDGRYVSVNHSQQFDTSLNKLQFLEFTTSNVCNQSCIMCNSQFSNQWTKIDHLFGFNKHSWEKKYSWADKNDVSRQETYIFNDKDVNKIIECLPDLKILMIKGGEPFVDMRNLKIIRKFFEVNDAGRVDIISNGSKIPEGYMDIMFRNPKRFTIHASIDAIGKRYEWIRGTPWKKTDDTLKRLYNETGILPRLSSTVSVYNIAHTTQLVDWARNAEYIDQTQVRQPVGVWHKNDIVWPPWCNPRKVLTPEQLNSIDDLPFPMESEFSNRSFKEFLKYTKIMNGVRGFDIDIWNNIENKSNSNYVHLTNL